MNTINTNESDLATLQNDLAALKRDMGDLLDHLKSGATSSAQNAAEHLDESARHLFHKVAAEGDRSAKAISQQVEQQPLMALLVALGIGYIAGRALSR